MQKSGECRPVILVADDDAATRFVFASTLENEGFTVVEAASAEEAIDAFRRSPPDVILMDVEMPGPNGYDACEVILGTRDGADIPIVMVTGHDDPQSIDHAYAVGATDFISKPINWSLIGHRLRYILRGAAHVKKIHRLAYFDALTGLPNRERFRELLDAFLERAQCRELAVFNIDLDRFKRINDTLGTATGDAVLGELALRLSAFVDESLLGVAANDGSMDCCLARIGGNEFALAIVDRANPVPVSSVAEQLRRCLAQPLDMCGHEFVVTGSVGVATFPDHGTTAETLMKHAESARGEAKRLGRNTQRVYRSTMSTGMIECLDLENELRLALENDELSMAYQPKYCTRTLESRGAEALIRWHHPERGEIPPAAFIPIAEESGLITDIGRWVADSVCEQVSLWRYLGVDTGPIAINISGQEFGQGDPVTSLNEAIEKAAIPASALELEITESVLLSDIRSVMSALHGLREQGFTVAVDDFGTGYSSLRYLQRFPVDILKIDSSFVSDVQRSAESRAICTAIIALARGLGLSVIGEGVENRWQLEFLKRERCDIAQGFLLGAPLPVEEFTEQNCDSSRRLPRDSTDRVVPLTSRL